MRLRICQSREGDALVLSQEAVTAAGSQWTHVMIDGGRSASYTESMRVALAALEASVDEARATVDLLVVSHIDQDHIQGVLQYADDLVDWAVRDYQLARADVDPDLDPSDVRLPGFDRPPRPLAAWHNSFDSLLDADGGGDDGLASRVGRVVASLAARFEPPVDLETTDRGTGAAAGAATTHVLEAGEEQAHQLTSFISGRCLLNGSKISN